MQTKYNHWANQISFAYTMETIRWQIEIYYLSKEAIISTYLHQSVLALSNSPASS